MASTGLVIQKCRENVGGATPSRFDYQIALALSYLLSFFGQDCIILLEALEDFAVIKNIKSGKPTVDIFQVKTKENGLMEKGTLLSEDVYGKIFLTDYYFSKNSTSLNIICNANLKGASTEHLDCFPFFSTLSTDETDEIEKNIVDYIALNSVNGYSLTAGDKGKLIYVKTNLPFPSSFNAPLISQINEIVNGKEENGHSINPQCIADSLIALCQKKRLPVLDPNSTLEDAIKKKGVSSEEISEIIEKQKTVASIGLPEIVASAIAYHISAHDVENIKSEYSSFLSKNNCFSDNLFHVFLNSLRIYMINYSEAHLDALSEEVVKAAHKEFLARDGMAYSDGVIWISCIWASLAR